MTSFWLENGMVRSGERPHVLVDCGYADHDACIDAMRELVRVFGKTHKRRYNAEVVGSNRIVFRVPPARAEELKQLSAVTVGGAYCWTTHKYGDGLQFVLPDQRKSPAAREAQVSGSGSLVNDGENTEQTPDPAPAEGSQ